MYDRNYSYLKGLIEVSKDVVFSVCWGGKCWFFTISFIFTMIIGVFIYQFSNSSLTHFSLISRSVSILKFFYLGGCLLNSVLPNPGITFLSFLFHISVAFGIAGHSYLLETLFFLGFQNINTAFLWVFSFQLLFFCQFFILFLLYLIIKYGVPCGPTLGPSCFFSLCSLLMWSHSFP